MTDRSEWQLWDRAGVAQEITSFWESSPYEAAHREALADLVAHRLPASSRRVLEVGCGSGAVYRRLVPRHLANRDYVGVDVSEQMLAIARRESPLGQYVRGDGYGLCFRDGAFDVVLCFEVLGHLPEIQPLLAEMLRVTRSLCVFTVWPSEQEDVGEGHEEIGGARFLHRRYSDAYVRRAVRACARGRSATIEQVLLSTEHRAYVVRPCGEGAPARSAGARGARAGRAEGTAPPRVLAVLPHVIPSTLLCVVKPLLGLHRRGEVVADVTLESWVSRRQVERADVVAFCRNLDPAHGGALALARSLGRPTLYDLDDNLFDLVDVYPGERCYLTAERLAQLELYVREASLVRVYSKPLLERVRSLNERVVRVDPPVDWSLVPSAPPRREPGKVRIVYATSRLQQDELAQMFLGDVAEILRVHRGRVELCFWGYHPPQLAGDPSVRFLAFERDYDRFFRRFTRAGFDIGLAPLRDDVFHRSKTNNKFREFAAARTAGVYSNVDVYADCVTDGQTGLLVGTEPGSWFRAISRLIEDAELRARIQEQSFAYVRERYDLAEAQQVWLDHVRSVLAAGRPPSSGAPPAPWSSGAVRVGAAILRTARARGWRAGYGQLRRAAREARFLARMRWSLGWPGRGGG